jgi:PII-like signaling protein
MVRLTEAARDALRAHVERMGAATSAAEAGVAPATLHRAIAGFKVTQGTHRLLDDLAAQLRAGVVA